MNTPQLYERIKQGNRVRYIPYQPASKMAEIDNSQVVTLITTLVAAILINIENQVPQHARIGREVRNVETALVRLAKLNAAPLEDDLIGVGVRMWDAAINSMAAELGALQ